MSVPWGRQRRAALAGALVAGLLVAESASMQGAVAAPPIAEAPLEPASVTFTTPGVHSWEVPDGVTRVDVVAIGGRGGSTARGRGGRAARIMATLTVAPGQTLHAVVGSSASGTTPGANGGGGAGGTAAECVNAPGAGGGATDVRTIAPGEPGSDASRVLVAAGGGGAGSLGSTDEDAQLTYGGHRGRGGGGGRAGGDNGGGWAGVGGVGGKGGYGGSAQTDGTSTTGGRGVVGAVGTGSGCGGGGGGGYGGGGAGDAGALGVPGGGGGGGGSLVPAGSGPIGVAARDDAPSLTFTWPGLPERTGPLRVTSTQTFKQDDQGRGPLRFTNCPSSCRWFDGDLGGAAPNGAGYDFGYASSQAWGSSALFIWDFLQSFVSVRPATPGAAVDVGVPFVLAHFAHYNIPIRGDSPTALGMQTLVTAQPPAGDPVVFDLRGGNTPPLNFLETDNTPPCDPSIQRSTRPCDDHWQLETTTPTYLGSVRQILPMTVTASGVTWHLDVLGWRTPAGTFERTLATEELAVNQADIYARITVDTNPTTSSLIVDDTDPVSPVLRLTTVPVPQTGGTVSFTDGGVPIEGCTDMPVDATDGVTECTPADLSPGAHSFAGSFNGGIGYAASAADPVEFTGLEPQTISFDAPSGVTYGDADIALGATASSGLPVTYSSSTPDVCITTGAALHIVAAGSCTVIASQLGDSTYAPAQQSRTFSIDKATLTVTADDLSRPYGAANPLLTATITGFVDGDPASVVSGEPSLSTTATLDSPPGEYPIDVSVAGLSAADYDFTGAGGTLTVTKAPTTTTLGATPNPSVLNQAVTLTATVSTSSSGATAPSGTVAFRLVGDPTPLASAPVVDGQASAVVLVPGGDHAIVATYSGDDTYEASSSAPRDTSVGCTRTISGRYGKSVKVASGTTCVLPGTTIDGSVTVAKGASLSLEGASVRGGVLASSPDAIRMCGSSAALVSVSRAAGFVLIGDPGHGCAPNTAGLLIAINNSGGLVAVDNTITGAVLAFGNTGAGPLPGQDEPVVSGNQG